MEPAQAKQADQSVPYSSTTRPPPVVMTVLIGTVRRV